MSGFIPATGILPAVLGTRIVLGEAAEKTEVLGASQESAPELFGLLLPFTGFALAIYLAIIVGLIVTGIALRRRGRRAVVEV